MLPHAAKHELQEALNETAKNTGLNLIMALSYSSRWEIANAIKKIAIDVKQDILQLEDINQDTIKQYLTTKAFPDPELMIRTSGEYRISNFLLYQLAYAELYFTPTLWPDFRKENLYAAILDYQSRERRFGKTGEQIKDGESSNTQSAQSPSP
jgi:undecaprenyl diphosphate synthase